MIYIVYKYIFSINFKENDIYKNNILAKMIFLKTKFVQISYLCSISGYLDLHLEKLPGIFNIFRVKYGI